MIDNERVKQSLDYVSSLGSVMIWIRAEIKVLYKIRETISVR